MTTRDYLPNRQGDVDEVHYYYFVDGNTSDYGITASKAEGSFRVNPNTGIFNGGTNLSYRWTHFTIGDAAGDPAVTLTSQNNNANMQPQGDDFILHTGSSPSCVYTLTAPAGLAAADRITGYTITGRAMPATSATQSVTMPATTGRFTSTEARDYSVTPATPTQTVSFRFTREGAVRSNVYSMWTGIEVNYTDANGQNPNTFVINSENGKKTSNGNRFSSTTLWEASGDFAVKLAGNNDEHNSGIFPNTDNTWFTGVGGEHRTDTMVIRLYSENAGNYTITVPDGYLITGITFRNAQSVMGSEGENNSLVTLTDELTSAEFIDTEEKTVTRAVGTPAQTAQFTLAANGSAVDGQITVNYIDASGTAGTATLNAANGVVDGTGTTFTSTTAPQFAITASAAGHVATTGNDLRLSSVGGACTFTLSAAEGYRIVSYTLTGKAALVGNSQTITSGGQTVTFTEDADATITVSGLTASTAQFTLGGTNTGLLVTNMTVNYSSTPNATYGGKHLIDLDLPIVGYTNGAYDVNQEPIAYFRWFDYRTDQASDHLLKYNSNDNKLASMLFANGNDAGLIAYNLPNNLNRVRRDYVGVYYSIPAEASQKDWKGDIIACDVSRYADYNDIRDENDLPVFSKNNLAIFTHEPTLSTRYIFHILPATLLADSMKTQLVMDHSRGADLTLDDKKELAFGAKDRDARFTLRTEMRRVVDYWFYPMQNARKHHVYYPDGEESTRKIVASDFAGGDKMLRANEVEWRVYSENKQYWRVFNQGSGSMVQTSINDLWHDGKDWYDLDGNPANMTGTDIGQGSTVYLVALAKNGNNVCPFFNCTLLLQHIYPRTKDQITTMTRQKSFLEARYTKIIDASFDGARNDFGAPTNVLNNMQDYPDDFRQRQYGFVYPTLADMNPWRNEHTDAAKYLRYGAMHGDYGLYKSAGVKGISTNEDGNNIIFSYDKKPFYDRTHEQDGNRYGQFLYVDASDEARQIGAYDVANQTLCSGSQIFVSAWVASMTEPTATQPEVRFNLYGIRKDADGFDLETKLLGGIASGTFTSNADGYVPANSQAVWYNVFGTFHLSAMSGAENYTDFRVTIDNYCDNTEGADYAVDDIQVYATNARITVIQSPPVCSDDTGDRPERIRYRIQGDYNTLHDMTEGQVGHVGVNGDRKVFYRFMMEENGEYVEDQAVDYGTGQRYGVAYIPALYDARRTIEGVPADKNNGMPDSSSAKFVNMEYGDNVVLANRPFGLSLSHTYYVSIALPDATGEAPGTWGTPTTPCSTYSRNFTVVKQSLAITDSTGRPATNIVAQCGTNWATQYGVTAVLTVPGRTTSGAVTLNTVPFDWYVVDNDGTPEGDPKDDHTNQPQDLPTALLAALRNFRAEYPTKTTLKGVTAKGTFTEADLKALSDELYNYNGSGGTGGSPTGHLFLTYSSSFFGNGNDTTYHMRVGSHTLYAIPTSNRYHDPVDGVDYELCIEPIQFKLNVIQSGPELEFGLKDVIYPEDVFERAVRLGLPQIRTMLKQQADGTMDTEEKYGKQVATVPLLLPVKDRLYSHTSTPKEVLAFVSPDGHQYQYTNAKKETLTCDTALWVYVVPYDEGGGPYSTNDPTIGQNVVIGTVSKTDFIPDDTTINVHFVKEACEILHEGYQYAIQFNVVRTDDHSSDAGTTTGEQSSAPAQECPGESYLLLKIVPEYLTWSPSGIEGTNWNIDENWQRSTAAEIYKADYTDYGTATYPADKPSNAVNDKLSRQQAYVPMDFTKVTVPKLTVRPYPMMPYIQYNNVGTAVELVNENGSFATADIEYDMQANPAAENDGTYYCRNFRGNVCQDIYFKAGAELMRQNYLQYGRAWVETEFKLGQWSTYTSPLKAGVSGDLYVPRSNGRQETEAFVPITFNAKQADGRTNAYSRVMYPFYQRTWGMSGGMYIRSVDGGKIDYARVNGPQTTTGGDEVDAFDHPEVMLVYPDETHDAELKPGETNVAHYNVWSHVFNRPDLLAPSGTGFSVRVGDDEFIKFVKEHYPDYLDSPVVLRLPKDDQTYTYYDPSGGKNVTATVAMRADDVRARGGDPSYRLGVDYDGAADALARIDHEPAAVEPAENHYYLLGNPYMSSISVQQFLTENRALLEDPDHLWILRGGVLYQLPSTNETSETDNVIHPFEAFFVKMKQVQELTFSNVMQVAVNVRSGSAAKANTEPIYQTYSVPGRAITVNIDGARGQVRVYSPGAGRVVVDNRTSTPLLRIDVVTTDGMLTATGRCEAGAQTELHAPRGIIIVRITRADGHTESHKVAVG